MNLTGKLGWRTLAVMRDQKLAAEGHEPELSDFRAFVGKINAKKRRKPRVKTKLLKATGLAVIALIAVTAGAAALTNNVVARHTVTRYMVPTGNESRAGKRWAETNVTCLQTVVRISPTTPLFTNEVAIKTNVVWKHWPVKPIRSPKAKL